MAEVKFHLEADRTKWSRHVNGQFRSLAKYLDAGAKGVANGLRNDVPGIVQSGLRRPENQARHPQSLADAIQQSIAPFARGRGKLDVGVRIVDVPTLDRLAVYWHAIEVGSDHLVGTKRAILFGFRVGGTFLSNKGGVPSPQSFRQHPDMIAGSAFSKGKPISRPIEPHGYLGQVSKLAITRFEREVDKRIRQVL